MATTLALLFCVAVYLITEWDNVRVRADLRRADKTIADLTAERDQARAEADDLTEYADSLEATLFGPKLPPAKPTLTVVANDLADVHNLTHYRPEDWNNFTVDPDEAS